MRDRGHQQVAPFVNLESAPMFYRLLILPLLIIPVACTVTGPADDGWENQNEWVDNGRLLSDDAKNIYRSSAKTTNNTPSGIEGFDYDAYQQWLKARESNSAEYQKFRQWQEFEAYYQWKQQQPR